MQQLFLKALLTRGFHFSAGKCPGALLSPHHLFQQWGSSIRSCGQPGWLENPAQSKISRKAPTAKLWKHMATPSPLCHAGFIGTWPCKSTPKNTL